MNASIKVTQGKEKPLLIILKEETQKKELFKNLNNTRNAERPLNRVNISWFNKTAKERALKVVEWGKGDGNKISK